MHKAEIVPPGSAGGPGPFPGSRQRCAGQDVLDGSLLSTLPWPPKRAGACVEHVTCHRSLLARSPEGALTSLTPRRADT